MTNSLGELCLSLAWSQWVSLGVSGTGVLVPRHAVHLETAIVFAPLLADLDPRLHDEILDWCIQFAGDFTSVSCLKHVLKQFDPEHRGRFERFAAIVNLHGGTKWPTSLAAPPFKPSGKSTCRLDHPSSVVLRGRKIFGINARADILVGLALYPPSPAPRWTHVNLLSNLGYSKRNLSEALNDLHAGGMLGTLRFGNTIRYALRHAEPLRALLAPVPDTPDHPSYELLALVASLIVVEHQTRGKSVTTQAVAVRQVLERRRSNLERSLLSVPTLTAGNPWPEIEAWLAPHLRP